MLRHQQGEIGVFGLARGVLVAVAIDGDDAVGVFIYHGALGIHAEGTHLIAVLFGAVDDLAFIQLIGKVGKDRRGQFHPHAQIHAVGVGGDIELPADGFHPLAAAAPYRDHTLLAGVLACCGKNTVAIIRRRDCSDGGIKEEGDLIL